MHLQNDFWDARLAQMKKYECSLDVQRLYCLVRCRLSINIDLVIVEMRTPA